jgi:hypothetical protein
VQKLFSSDPVSLADLTVTTVTLEISIEDHFQSVKTFSLSRSWARIVSRS